MIDNFLINSGGKCECGKQHVFPIKSVIIKNGAILDIAKVLKKFNAKRPFVLADKNTYTVAGQKVISVLENANITYSTYVYNDDFLEPDEKTVGSAIMHYDNKCDIIIGVGSGVINDVSKILSSITNNIFVVVATAPSMDGYASSTSSMSLSGLKTSLQSKCADVIIGDIDVLKNAPVEMLTAGLGDMLAKYISICEWKIANEVVGEYYCERVAKFVKNALDKCVKNANGLLNREEKSVKAVFEGLIVCGVAMAYAGISRPASGVEHYISHIIDMRGIEYGEKTNLHGIQCAVATLMVSRIYEQILNMIPNKDKALNFVKEFQYNEWAAKLSQFLGKGAVSMVVNEKAEGKYDKQKHAERLNIIIEKWDKIISIIREEIPSSSFISSVLDVIKCPKTLSEAGINCDVEMVFKCTKDIRDKYVLSRLLWDIGEIDNVKILQRLKCTTK